MPEPRKIALCTTAELAEMADSLKALHPPPKGYTVTVARVPYAQIEAWGATSKKGRRFLIEIAREQTKREVELVLLHEMAHVHVWAQPHSVRTDHDAHWGVAFAAIYRRYMGCT